MAVIAACVGGAVLVGRVDPELGIREALASSGTTAGTITVVDGMATDTGNGDVATPLTPGQPSGTLGDAEGEWFAGGNLFIADGIENRVEEVAGSNETQFGISMTGGHMYTVAGSDTGAASPLNVPPSNGTLATSALVNDPTGVVTDSSGDLLIADAMDNAVEVVAAGSSTPYTTGTTSVGHTYRVAGNSSGLSGHSGANGVATSARLFAPSGLAIGTNGKDLYIADRYNNRVMEVSESTGEFNWKTGQSFTAGDIYDVAGNVNGTSGSSGSTTSSSCSSYAYQAYLSQPNAIAISHNGHLYIADSNNNRVQEVSASTHTQWGVSEAQGCMYTFAAAGGALVTAHIYNPAM